MPRRKTSRPQKCYTNASNFIDEESIPLKKEKKDETNNHIAKIKKLFLVDMPNDFYQFWEFCKTVNLDHPESAFEESLGFKLCGPYDVLTEKLLTDDLDESLCHNRYEYDVPEFLTVINGDPTTKYHIGYFRDDPAQMPDFLASNVVSEGCKINPIAKTIFGAMKVIIGDVIKSDKMKEKILESTLTSLIEFAEAKGINLESKSESMKTRDNVINAKTFHGAGIVVPINNGVGYRPITVSYAKLKKLLDKIAQSETAEAKLVNEAELEELITLVQFANDECDFGMGLELGINLFCDGRKQFHSLLRFILPMAYRMLKREPYAIIVEKFLKQTTNNDD